MKILTLLFLFMVAHAVTDLALQTDMFKYKSRLAQPRSEWASDNIKYLWIYILTAHALINAGGVIVIAEYIRVNAGFNIVWAHSVSLGMMEFVFHWLIDKGSTEQVYGLGVDQLLHVLSKLLYCCLLLL